MKTEKPLNLLFIYTDQQRPDTMKVYGNEKIKAPNLNKLSEESVVFRRTYVAQPVCTPSRATIVSGLCPHSHGLTTNNLILSDEVPTIADMAKKAGYQTAHMGKWHLGNEVVAQHGFDKWVSTEDGFYRSHFEEKYREIHCSYHDFLTENGFKPDREEGDYMYFSRDFATRIPEEFSKCAFTAKEADKFIKQNKDQPFLLYVNFLDPHPPYFSAYDEEYSPDEVDLPPNFNVDLAEGAPLKCRLGQLRQKYEGRHFPLKNEAAWRRQIARYWGQVTNLDHYTGEILASLKAHGVEDNTVVVFTSDHGDMMGDFRMIAKGVMFESSTRVPLLIKVPGVTDKQRIVEEPVGHIDLVPTLLDILGLPEYDNAQGKSLYPVIKGNEPLAGSDVFVEYSFGSEKGGTKFDGLMETDAKPELEKIWPDVQRTYSKAVKERTVISADLFKLNLTEAAENELYDLNTDPHERTNLYTDPDYADKVIELRQKILAWQKRTGDDAEI